jgi:phosphohistidine phosphatase SixA
MSCDLILLRHAKAEPAGPGQGDIERGLTERGEREADAAGAWLKQHKVHAPRIVASSAARAQATATRVMAQLDDAELATEPGIYEATPGELIQLIEPRLAAGQTLIVVGHNPGLEQLVAFLSEGRSEDFRGLPTAGVAWLTVPGDAALEPGATELRHFWSPQV